MSDLQPQILAELQTMNRTIGGLETGQAGLRRDVERQAEAFDEYRRLIDQRDRERMEALDRVVADFDSNTGLLTKKVDDMARLVGQCPLHQSPAPATVEDVEARGFWKTMAKVLAAIGTAIGGWYVGKD